MPEKKDDLFITKEFCSSQHDHLAKELDLKIRLAKHEIVAEIDKIRDSHEQRVQLSWAAKAAIIGSVIVSIASIIVALIEQL